MTWFVALLMDFVCQNIRSCMHCWLFLNLYILGWMSQFSFFYWIIRPWFINFIHFGFSAHERQLVSVYTKTGTVCFKTGIYWQNSFLEVKVWIRTHTLPTFTTVRHPHLDILIEFVWWLKYLYTNDSRLNKLELRDVYKNLCMRIHEPL